MLRANEKEECLAVQHLPVMVKAGDDRCTCSCEAERTPICSTALRDETLFLCSLQLPGMVEAGDMTDILSRGHWGSYNVPSFPSIYNASGYPQELAAINRDQSEATDEDAREKYEVSKRWLMYQVRGCRGCECMRMCVCTNM